MASFRKVYLTPQTGGALPKLRGLTVLCMPPPDNSPLCLFVSLKNHSLRQVSEQHTGRYLTRPQQGPCTRAWASFSRKPGAGSHQGKPSPQLGSVGAGAAGQPLPESHAGGNTRLCTRSNAALCRLTLRLGAGHSPLTQNSGNKTHRAPPAGSLTAAAHNPRCCRAGIGCWC